MRRRRSGWPTRQRRRRGRRPCGAGAAAVDLRGRSTPVGSNRAAGPRAHLEEVRREAVRRTARSVVHPGAGRRRARSAGRRDLAVAPPADRVVASVRSGRRAADQAVQRPAGPTDPGAAVADWTRVPLNRFRDIVTASDVAVPTVVPPAPLEPDDPQTLTERGV